MDWTDLRTDYTNAQWSGLKRYKMIENSDGTVSFQDVTQYRDKDNSFFGANEANQMNAAMNLLAQNINSTSGDAEASGNNAAAAQKSANAAALSERNAAASEQNAAASEQNAETHASATATSEANAVACAAAAAASEANAAESERVAAEYLDQVKTITTGAQGYYATPEALRAAVPIGSDGWWAVVGSTDTIWVWDSDTGSWVDSHDMTELGEFYTRKQVDAMLKTCPYEVGDILTTKNATHPSTRWPGTVWTAIETMLLGASDAHPAGTTGGAESASYTPAGTVAGTALTTNQIPAHTHGSKSLVGTITGLAGSYGATGIASVTGTVTFEGANDYYNDSAAKVTINATHEHTSVGGGATHTHGFTGTSAEIQTMPPYTAVYVWERTA